MEYQVVDVELLEAYPIFMLFLRDGIRGPMTNVQAELSRYSSKTLGIAHNLLPEYKC